MKVYTESGSIYELNRKAMTWVKSREVIPDPISPMRTTTGKLTKWPDLQVGEPLVLICPPLVEGTEGRAILGTRVVWIEKSEQD